MRQERIIQASLFEIFATHEIGRELKQISGWLDQHRPLLRLVSNDLRRDGVRETGRRGLPAEAVLRCALLKQYRQLSYEELAFHLEDSASFRAFARLPMGWTPKKAVLQKTISAITAASWEAINQAVVRNARQTKLEPAAMVRIDSTVTEALMHEPSDSSLLWDAVRVMTRLLKRAGSVGRHCRDQLARSPPVGQEARPGHRVQPRQRTESEAVSRTSCRHACHQSDAGACARAAGGVRWACRRGLVPRSPPLPALDRARHDADQAPGVRRRSGAGQ